MSKKEEIKAIIESFEHFADEFRKVVDGIGSHDAASGEVPTYNAISPGTPTQTVDVNGRVLCLGDVVGYDGHEGEDFEIVFAENAFRKKYGYWDEREPMLIVEVGEHAKVMGLIWKASPWQRRKT